MMHDKDFADMEVRRAAGEAGDASGNADAAAFLFKSGDIAGAISRLQLAREQSEKAMRAATQAEWRLRRLIELATDQSEG